MSDVGILSPSVDVLITDNDPIEVSGLNKSQAEALLDWLDAWGCSALGGSIEEDGFTVRWTWPPARSLSSEQIRQMISAMTRG